MPFMGAMKAAVSEIGVAGCGNSLNPELIDKKSQVLWISRAFNESEWRRAEFIAY
jgi:hypothetical protein